MYTLYIYIYTLYIHVYPLYIPVYSLYIPIYSIYTRNIQAALVDMENMLELLNVDQDVKDLAKAPEINIQRGEIEFKDVFFHYQPR